MNSTTTSRPTPPRARKKGKLRRDDPSRKRKLELDVGSEHEIGRELLNVLRDEGDGHEIVAAEGSLWEYVELRGLWTPVPEDESHRIVGTFDGSEFTDGKQLKALRVSDAFARGAIRRAMIIASAPDFFATAAPVLVFADCAVRLSDAGEIERLPHSPDHRARVGYPFAHDPQAKCERFEQMMREHFEGDPDAAEKIACEQEFFGGGLCGLSTRYQKCLALLSDGGGGRSTTLEAVEAAFPVRTVSHIDAKELRSAERRTRLVGKLLNFSDEVPSDAFLESEDFKKVVAGNVVTAEGKYRASFEFRPTAGHVFPIQMTGAAEVTTAFFRRQLMIRYNRCFEGDPSRDKDLAPKIVRDESAGIVRWLIEGAARLLRQGGYTVPASHDQELLRWRIDADTVTAFVAATMARAVFDGPKDRKKGVMKRTWERHDWTLSERLFDEYKEWCRANGHRNPVASGKFSERLRKVGVRSKHTEKGTAYAIISRERVQRREDERAEHEGRRPRTIPGFFDKLQPALALVSPRQPDRLTPTLTGPSSGTKPIDSSTYNEPDNLTGVSEVPICRAGKKVSANPCQPVRKGTSQPKTRRTSLTDGPVSLSGRGPR